uniref:HTH_48 domain-containing protein n=1 Tax=Glossina pallidipes TaxID=7398 RepID=A0A1A9ZC32_GLOPL
MDRSEICTVMKYEFLHGTTTSQIAPNINSVFGSSVTTQQTVSDWFAKFRIGKFDLTNDARGRSQSKVNNDVLNIAVVYELLLKFGVSKQTISTDLAQIGRVKKLDKSVPHQLNGKQKQKHFEACLMFPSTQCDNRERSAHVSFEDYKRSRDLRKISAEEI